MKEGSENGAGAGAGAGRGSGSGTGNERGEVRKGNRWGTILQFFTKNYDEVINSVLMIYQKYGISQQWFLNQFKLLQYNIFPTRSFLSSSPYSSYTPKVTNATGLENLGNTCFLNAMLQALASLPSIRNYVDIISSYDQESHQLTFIRKLSKCFKELRSNDGGATVSAKDIYQRITNYRRGLGDFEQQDVGECLQAMIGIISNEEKALLSQLHCSVKYLFFSPQSSRSLPTFPFNGLVSSVVTCHKCNHSRPPRIQNFTELSIPVQAPLSTPSLSLFHPHDTSDMRSTAEVMKLQRLSDCLGRFAAGEILNEVECLMCSYYSQLESFRILTGSSWANDSQNMKSLREVNERMQLLEQNQSSEKKLEELIPEKDRERTTATKQLMVSKFPEILCFQLIRNIFDMKTQRMIKLKHHITFPIEFHENDMCIGLNYRVNLSPNTHINHHHTKGISRRIKPSSSSSSLSSSTGSIHGSEIDRKGKLYHLHAVIVHHGGSESGHYTTYAQIDSDNAAEESERKRRWAHFSDETVREVNEKEVLGCEAYLLFYHRVIGTAASSESASTEMKIS